MLRVIFVGTADFACSALRTLADAGSCEILAVYTKPDKPKGRGLKLLPSPVKLMAQDYGLPVMQPTSMRDPETLEQLKAWQADLLVNVACGFLLPVEVLTLFPKGCVNIHPSLLPRWRGAAPIQRAIMAGDQFTGVSIMQMDEGLDTGAVYLQEKIEIADSDNCGSLSRRLAELSGGLLLQVLDNIACNKAVAVAQTLEGVSYADKISKEERVIDWSDSARAISCKIRALNPDYVAYTTLNGERWLVRDAVVTEVGDIVNGTEADGVDGCGDATSYRVGQVLAVRPTGVAVATGHHELIWLTSLQAVGGCPLTAKDFYNAYRKVWVPGVVLGM